MLKSVFKNECDKKLPKKQKNSKTWQKKINFVKFILIINTNCKKKFEKFPKKIMEVRKNPEWRQNNKIVKKQGKHQKNIYKWKKYRKTYMEKIPEKSD